MDANSSFRPRGMWRIRHVESLVVHPESERLEGIDLFELEKGSAMRTTGM